jgi:hypothetical protein
MPRRPTTSIVAAVSMVCDDYELPLKGSDFERTFPTTDEYQKLCEKTHSTDAIFSIDTVTASSAQSNDGDRK